MNKSGAPHQSNFWIKIISVYSVNIQTNPKVIERKHIAYHTGLVYIPRPVINGTDTCAGMMRVD